MLAPINSDVLQTVAGGTPVEQHQGFATILLILFLSIYAFRGLGMNKVFVAFLYYGAVGMFSLFIPLVIMVAFDRFFFNPPGLRN